MCLRSSRDTREEYWGACRKGGLPGCVGFGAQVVPGVHFEKHSSMWWIRPLPSSPF